MYNVFVIALQRCEVRRAGFRDWDVKVYGPRPQAKYNVTSFFFFFISDVREHKTVGKRRRNEVNKR